MGKNGQLGQLFVELGFKGAGAIKGIDVAAGKFLLLKNAAQQMGQVFDSTIKGVVGNAVHLDKLNKITGFSTMAMQKWMSVAKQNNVSQDLVAQSFQNLDDIIAKFKAGGKIDLHPFSLLGISSQDILNQDAQTIFKQVQSRIGKYDKAQQRNILGEMGISPEMLILMGKINDNVSNNVYLNEKEQSALLEVNRQWIALGITIDNVGQKLLSKLSPKVVKRIKEVKEIVELPTAPKQQQQRTKWKIEKKVQEFIAPGGIIGDLWKKKLNKEKIAPPKDLNLNIQTTPLYDPKSIPSTVPFTQFTPPESGMPLPPLPSNLKSQAPTSINVSQNINSTADAKTVASYSVDGIKQAFGDYELLNKDVV